MTSRGSEKVVAVALGNPYLIRQFPNVSTYLVTYGVGDALERAAAAVVLGRAPVDGNGAGVAAGLLQARRRDPSRG